MYHSGTNKDNAVRFYATDFLYNSKWCIWPKRFTAGRQKQINSTSFATFLFSNFYKHLTSYENRIFHALQNWYHVWRKQIFFVQTFLDLEFPTCVSRNESFNVYSYGDLLLRKIIFIRHFVTTIFDSYLPQSHYITIFYEWLYMTLLFFFFNK